jgi:hypothetical protein
MQHVIQATRFLLATFIFLYIYTLSLSGTASSTVIRQGMGTEAVKFGAIFMYPGMVRLLLLFPMPTSRPTTTVYEAIECA